MFAERSSGPFPGKDTPQSFILGLSVVALPAAGQPPSRASALQRFLLGLAPARFQAYLMTKDPLYRQAQMTAMQYGAPSRAVMPIYNMTKANENRRQQILTNATLSAQQKNEELNRVNMDQLRTLQQIVNEANAAR